MHEPLILWRTVAVAPASARYHHPSFRQFDHAARCDIGEPRLLGLRRPGLPQTFGRRAPFVLREAAGPNGAAIRFKRRRGRRKPAGRALRSRKLKPVVRDAHAAKMTPAQFPAL